MERQFEGIGVCSGFLMPHPPVLLPEIGKGRERDAQKTGAACIKVATLAAGFAPQTVVVISPHAPLFSDYVFVYDEPVLTGSFARFGAPDIVCTAEQDTELRTAILGRLAGEKISAGALSADRIARMGFDRELDHGILVPLYFLQQAGTATKIVGLSSPAMDIAALKRIGQCIAAAARDAGRNVCVVASGDMSHKVNRESPYGEVAEGAEFDRLVCTALDSSNMSTLYRMDPVLRARAAECGYASLVMLSSVFENPRCTRYSYEAPFGIGYCVASFEPE